MGNPNEIKADKSGKRKARQTCKINPPPPPKKRQSIPMRGKQVIKVDQATTVKAGIVSP